MDYKSTDYRVKQIFERYAKGEPITTKEENQAYWREDDLQSCIDFDDVLQTGIELGDFDD